MTHGDYNPDYPIHSDEEPLRLERQARLYGSEEDLAFLQLAPDSRVLDAGCGAGSVARLMARAVPQGQVQGLDREPRYLVHARRAAQAEGLANLSFDVGDVLAMPYEDGRFDVVWSKHLLQWVARREQALAEMVRVTRRGGRVVCCNFDRFCLAHYPTDPALQAELEAWFAAAQEAFGFDNDLGRKLPHLMQAAGLQDLRWQIGPDRAFCGFGGHPERRWNWQVQFHAALPFSAWLLGSEAAALAFHQRVVERFSRPDVFVYATLFHVEGRVP